VSDPADGGDAIEGPGGSFVRHTAVMSVGTALSRVTGFLRIAAIAWAVGIAETRLASVYYLANNTPNIIYELALGGVLSSVFVPVFVEWLQARGREEAWDVARRVFTITVVALMVLALAGMVLAPWIIRLYTSGVPDDQREAVVELGTFFLRWFMPQIVFYGIGAVAIGLLNAHGRFAAPMFAPILNNLIVIGTFVTYALIASDADRTSLATSPEKAILGIGTTLGIVGMTVALWPSLRATGFRFRWNSAWRHEAVIRVAHLAKWTVVYVAVNQVAYLFVLILANREPGGVAAYTSAFILFQLPHAIFTVSVFTALLPAMSSRWTDRDLDGFRALLRLGIGSTAVIVIPAAAGLFAIAVPIVRLLLQHGVAGPDSTELVADVLSLFALGLFPFSSFMLLTRSFYAMQDSRTPALVNVIGGAFHTAANFAFFFWLDLGVPGLALGHAVGYAAAAVLLLLLIRRRLGRVDGRALASVISRTTLAAVVTGVVAWAVARGIGSTLGTATLASQLVQVGAAVAAGVLAFFLSALMLRIREVDALISQLTARWRR
jgi:putative peptidoglycan lipid II flippase